MGMTSPIAGAKETQISVGDLRFTAWEMGQGPLVLCLHGFPDTVATWRHLLPELAGAGCRAVAVTARGYEPSSQPADGDYGMAALADDVGGWIAQLGVEKAHLIGHDWGASISYAAAAKFPDRVASLTTLAVPHPLGLAGAMMANPEQLKRSWYVFLFQIPGLSDMAVAANDWAFLDMLWRDWSPGWSGGADDLAAVKRAFGQPGVAAAALGYYRAAFDASAPRLAEGQALATLPIQAPTLGLCGETDGCISADVFASGMPAAAFPGGVRVERINGAGHFMQLEAPEAVNRAILGWLAANG